MQASVYTWLHGCPGMYSFKFMSLSFWRRGGLRESTLRFWGETALNCGAELSHPDSLRARVSQKDKKGWVGWNSRVGDGVFLHDRFGFYSLFLFLCRPCAFVQECVCVSPSCLYSTCALANVDCVCVCVCKAAQDKFEVQFDFYIRGDYCPMKIHVL